MSINQRSFLMNLLFYTDEGYYLKPIQKACESKHIAAHISVVLSNQACAAQTEAKALRLPHEIISDLESRITTYQPHWIISTQLLSPEIIQKYAPKILYLKISPQIRFVHIALYHMLYQQDVWPVIKEIIMPILITDRMVWSMARQELYITQCLLDALRYLTNAT